jgi:hypothetical protein
MSALAVILAVGDVVWQGVIAGAVTIVLAWIGHRAKAAADQAAVKAEEVKVDLKASDAETSKKLNEMAEVGEATHTLVNANMGVQLLLNATVTRRLADITKDPVDAEAAGLAQKLYDEHQAKQATVDAHARKDK